MVLVLVTVIVSLHHINKFCSYFIPVSVELNFSVAIVLVKVEYVECPRKSYDDQKRLYKYEFYVEILLDTAWLQHLLIFKML